MVTILITEDEKKIKEILTQLLQQEGYSISDKLEGQNNIIRIAKKESIRDIDSLKDKVIELGDSLYREKRGILYKSILEAIEKPLIEQVLERTKGNQLKAARILGINRNTMRAKIRRLGIDVNRWKV